MLIAKVSFLENPVYKLCRWLAHISVLPLVLQAVDELFKMMRLMITRYPDMSNDEWKAIAHFKRSNIQLFLQNLDARTSWQTLITWVNHSHPSFPHSLSVTHSDHSFSHSLTALTQCLPEVWLLWSCAVTSKQCWMYEVFEGYEMIISLFLFFPLSWWGAGGHFFTASSTSLLHPPLSLVFFFQSSSSPAFFTSLNTVLLSQPWPPSSYYHNSYNHTIIRQVSVCLSACPSVTRFARKPFARFASNSANVLLQTRWCAVWF